MQLLAMKDGYIRFSQGIASGNSGCNRFSGSFTMHHRKLNIGPLAGTRMMCSEEIMTVENAFLKACAEADHYLISGDRMQLMKGDSILAEFEALYV